MRSIHCYVILFEGQAGAFRDDTRQKKKTQAKIKTRGAEFPVAKKNQATREGSSAPKAVVLTCVINGALTRWQVFEHITALT